MHEGWQERLDASATEAQIVAVARDFLASLSEGEVSRLPHPCRPPSIDKGKDITEYAYVLVRHHCLDNDGTARLVHKIANFLADASIRLAQVERESATAGGQQS